MIMMKYLRVNRNLSLRDVEKMTGISSSHLSRLENRERCYSGNVMHTLAEFYGVQPEILTLEHDLVQDDGDVIVDITQRHPKEIASKTVSFYANDYTKALQLLSKIKFKEDLEMVEVMLEKIVALQLTNRPRTKIVPKDDNEESEENEVTLK